MEPQLFRILLWSYLGLAVVTFLSLQLVVAPYGRHTRGGWGPQISSTWGWVIMEAPAALGFATIYWLGERRLQPGALALFALWELHYLNRAFVFPFRRRGGDKPMPLVIAAVAVVFNLPNAYLNARWITHFSTGYGAGWLIDPRFVVGATLFLVGLAINWHSDRVLRELRRPGETGYKIPVGGLYRLVSCPNYLGEMLEWTGWAVAAWSPAGLMFALYTAANLIPRARANHRWYRETFADYPAERRAVVPLLY